jgi:hypothetical protein
MFGCQPIIISTVGAIPIGVGVAVELGTGKAATIRNPIAIPIPMQTPRNQSKPF